jgi:hypothetical protein
MPKRMIVSIGYDTYAFTPHDFSFLADMAERAPLVKRDGYGNPYRATGERQTFITSAILDDFEEAPPTPISTADDPVPARPVDEESPF